MIARLIDGVMGILIFVIFLGDKCDKAALVKQIKSRLYAVPIPI